MSTGSSKPKYILFTKAFWADTAERVVFTAAQAVGAVATVDQVMPNAFALDYEVLAGIAAGGALLALVKQLGKLGVTAQVPASAELEELKAALAELKRSGGDVELRSTEQSPTANVELRSTEIAPH